MGGVKKEPLRGQSAQIGGRSWKKGAQLAGVSFFGAVETVWLILTTKGELRHRQRGTNFLGIRRGHTIHRYLVVLQASSFLSFEGAGCYIGHAPSQLVTFPLDLGGSVPTVLHWSLARLFRVISLVDQQKRALQWLEWKEEVLSVKKVLHLQWRRGWTTSSGRSTSWPWHSYQHRGARILTHRFNGAWHDNINLLLHEATLLASFPTSPSPFLTFSCERFHIRMRIGRALEWG